MLDRLLDGVADHLVARDRVPGRVDRHGQEGVEAELEVVRAHRLLQRSLSK
jgi:hypothetical protein